ncbi:tetratricopeptide repeat protein [Pyxidicoccus caerfyrddinensis]|uniref:tetratricopeptide repeat protein n=1 Tax=Pyxidicoccus caerfyrddinensis TaxID=2709663 RepID=UPI0013DB5A41|nr:tetratricopeptide repeat protein [Pyxidicoccus caerfyrddinensis]
MRRALVLTTALLMGTSFIPSTVSAGDDGAPPKVETPDESRPVARDYSAEEVLQVWARRSGGTCGVGDPWSEFSAQRHSPATLAVLRKLAEEPRTREPALSALFYSTDASLFPLLKRLVASNDLRDDEVRLLAHLLMMSRSPQGPALAQAQWGRSPRWTEELLDYASDGVWKPGRERIESILQDSGQSSAMRATAFRALVASGEVPEETLIERGFAAPEPGIRAMAVSLAAKYPGRLEQLVAALREPDERVRFTAATALHYTILDGGEPSGSNVHPHSEPIATAYARLTAMAERPESPLRDSIELLFLLAHHAERHGDFTRAERFYREAAALPRSADGIVASQGQVLFHLARLLMHLGRPEEAAPFLLRLEQLGDDSIGAPDVPYMFDFNGDAAQLAHRVREELRAPLRLSVEPLKQDSSFRITLRNVSQEVQYLRLYEEPPRKAPGPGPVLMLSVAGAEPRKPLPGLVLMLLDGRSDSSTYPERNDPSREHALKPGQAWTFTGRYDPLKVRQGQARLDALVEVESRGERGGLFKERLQAVTRVSVR